MGLGAYQAGGLRELISIETVLAPKMILTNNSSIKITPIKVEWSKLNFCGYFDVNGYIGVGGKTYPEFGFKETLSWIWAPVASKEET